MNIDYTNYTFVRGDITINCGRESYDNNNPDKVRGSFVRAVYNPTGYEAQHKGLESQSTLLIKCLDEINGKIHNARIMMK